MVYKNWNIVTSEEYNGIVVDCVDPKGNRYREPFCFSTYDEAVSYGKMCIDQLIRLEARRGFVSAGRGQLSLQG